MIIRRYFTICIVAVACLVAALCESCSVEEPSFAGSYTYPMQMDAVLNGYDGASTRSGYDWPDGAKLYVQFYEGESRVQGFAEYSENNDRWTVTTHTGLSHVSNARCEAYYFGHSAETADVVELSENAAVYQDVAGSYICDAKGLFVSLALTPRTGRIRFCGEVGRSFTVSGLTHLSTYETSSNNFSSTSESLSLTVSEDGYTPYLYANFPEASRTMVIVDGNMEYTRECTESVLAIGKSGCMTIPTTTAHDGWTVDESAVADAIDLGLSVKWASWNVGADSPEEYGDYFAWGETSPKSDYNENNSVTYGISISELESRGIIDTDGNLTAEYDAATVNWGGAWRMPTLDEIEELINKCTWEWTIMNGVIGYKVTASNGNSIFLPPSGFRNGTSLYFVGIYGYYWSATPYVGNDSHDACGLTFSKDIGNWTNPGRYPGISVRPVYDDSQPSISVTTGDAMDITDNGATLGGIITNANQSLTCGIIYGTSSTLSSTSGTMLSTSSSGEFSIDVTGLSPNTTYYYCAYVEVDGEYKYGEVRSFTTEAISIPAGEAIDLGLSVKWASWNVGAESPEDYGDYFAWGETTTKSSYSSDNSVTYGLSISELESRGIIDADGNLTAAYDAATANWGDEWRMPTKAEQDELRAECDWEWTKMNGVNGYKVTGPNGNSIFLPAAGYFIDTLLGFAGDLGCYWSATPYGDDNGAYYLSFGSDGYDWRNYDRYDGHAVRPVYGPARPSVSVTTGEATDITDYGATLGGIVSNSDEPVTCGIIYDISSTLSSTSGTMLSTSSSGEFSIEVTGLSPNTTYYYCAYVVVNGEYQYGDVLSFTTETETITVAEAIDLGLSVKWASWNVGAESPEEYGGYYAWGETTTKSSYTEGNSITFGLSVSELESRGIIDADGNLTAAYDAATANWGDEWRMPTLDEISELLDNCTWNWTMMNGVNGYKVVGSNGNSIFLPAAGCLDDTWPFHVGYEGYYRSATPYDGDSRYACYLNFYDGNYSLNYFGRGFGYAVRPVYGPARPSISVTTGEATDITDYGATLGGIVSNSDEPVTCGIIYDISSTLSSTSGTMLSTSSSGEFSIEVTGLSPNTTYYYCAYVEVDGEYKYGEVRSFTTEADISITAGDAIDLGLSVKWASCNIGANSPEEYGDYFAWGETTTKSSYSSSLLSDVLDNSISGLKSLGIIDANGNLTAAYDAATVNWGDEWRMPTSDEIRELVNNCTWRWTTQNGVYGYKVVGPNGNSIFLPAAGYRDYTSLDYAGSLGYYWSATPRGEYIWVYSLVFSNSSYSNNTNFDFYGFSVRPVYGPARPSISVTTGEATDITDYGATLGGIVSNSDEPVTCGIIYDISSTLSSTSGTMLSTSSSGEFSIEVTGLSPNTTYYYCAYVEVDGEYKYGEVLSFTTESETITVAEAVDLGLSVKWASWNVGATASEEYGDYFAWGETTTKSSYSSDNSVTYGLSISELESRGIIDADGNLTAAYDAATANWGDEWRMPTKAEQDELRTECDWEWTKMNGVNGYKVIGPNGNSIFLPAAGYRIGTSLLYAGPSGFYWSATPYSDSYSAYYICLDSYYYDGYVYGNCHYGHAVRPVSE